MADTEFANTNEVFTFLENFRSTSWNGQLEVTFRVADGRVFSARYLPEGAGWYTLFGLNDPLMCYRVTPYSSDHYLHGEPDTAQPGFPQELRDALNTAQVTNRS